MNTHILKLFLVVFVLFGFSFIGEASEVDLTKYSRASKVWLATFAGEVTVEPVEVIKVKKPGKFKLIVEDGSVVAKGDLIANVDVENLEFSAIGLELAKAEYVIKRQAIEDEYREKILSLKTQLAEIDTELLGLNFTQKERDLLGNKLLAKVKLKKSEIEEKRERVERKLNSDLLEEELRIKRDKQELELNKQIKSHDDLVRNAEIRSPFDGRVKVLKTDRAKSASDEIVEIKRLGFSELALRIVDSRVRSVAIDELEVKVNHPKGDYIATEFLRQEGGRQQGRDSLIYIYKLKLSEGEEFDEEINGVHAVSFYKDLGKLCYLVPKSEFLFNDTELIREKGWRGLVEEKFGNSVNIHYIGPRTIALSYEN